MFLFITIYNWICMLSLKTQNLWTGCSFIIFPLKNIVLNIAFMKTQDLWCWTEITAESSVHLKMHSLSTWHQDLA